MCRHSPVNCDPPLLFSNRCYFSSSSSSSDDDSLLFTPPTSLIKNINVNDFTNNFQCYGPILLNSTFTSIFNLPLHTLQELLVVMQYKINPHAVDHNLHTCLCDSCERTDVELGGIGFPFFVNTYERNPDNAFTRDKLKCSSHHLIFRFVNTNYQFSTDHNKGFLYLHNPNTVRTPIIYILESPPTPNRTPLGLCSYFRSLFPDSCPDLIPCIPLEEQV